MTPHTDSNQLRRLVRLRGKVEIAGTRRAYFLSDLFRASSFIFHLDGERSYKLEMRSYRPLRTPSISLVYYS